MLTKTFVGKKKKKENFRFLRARAHELRTYPHPRVTRERLWVTDSY